MTEIIFLTIFVLLMIPFADSLLETSRELELHRLTEFIYKRNGGKPYPENDIDLSKKSKDQAREMLRRVKEEEIV